MPAITFDYAALYYLNWWLKYDRHYCVALKSSDPETQRAALVKAAAVYRVARNPRLEHDKEGHRLATALQIIGKPDQREFKGAKLRTSPPSQILTGFKSASYLIPLARRRVTLRHDPPHYLAPFLDVVFCAIAAAILLPPPGIIARRQKIIASSLRTEPRSKMRWCASGEERLPPGPPVKIGQSVPLRVLPPDRCGATVVSQ